MRDKQILEALEQWASAQATIHHRKCVEAGWHKYPEDDDPTLAAEHGGQATAYEDVVEKIAELRRRGTGINCT